MTTRPDASQNMASSERFDAALHCGRRDPRVGFVDLLAEWRTDPFAVGAELRADVHDVVVGFDEHEASAIPILDPATELAPTSLSALESNAYPRPFNNAVASRPSTASSRSASTR